MISYLLLLSTSRLVLTNPVFHILLYMQMSDQVFPGKLQLSIYINFGRLPHHYHIQEPICSLQAARSRVVDIEELFKKKLIINDYLLLLSTARLLPTNLIFDILLHMQVSDQVSGCILQLSIYRDFGRLSHRYHIQDAVNFPQAAKSRVVDIQELFKKK